jgi:hypothetical protein
MPITSTKNFSLSSGFGVSNSMWPRWARSKIGSGCIVSIPSALELFRFEMMPIAIYAPSFRGASETSEPGIHNHEREYGFRACAKWRIPK